MKRNPDRNKEKWKAEYSCWHAMKKRCLNPNTTGYEYYGGRGIKVCERWYSFENFFSDMGPKPSSNHSIERINVNGNYEPGNCKWATIIEQANNTRANHIIEFNGKSQTMSMWARELGVHCGTIYWRIKGGWPIDKVLSPVVNKPKPRFNRHEELKELMAQGLRTYEIAKRLNSKYATIYGHIQKLNNEPKTK